MSAISEQIKLEIDRLPDHEFDNLTRSTIPLLCYWKINPEAKLAQLSQAVDLNLPEPIFGFGFEVASIPDARASETDLMIRASGQALAIEAKWSEPRYKTVAPWKAETTRWKEALQHWLDLISPFANVPSVNDADALVYQMIHRCASACAAAGKDGTAAFIYQVFASCTHSKEFYGTDLKDFVKVIRPKPSLRVALQIVDLITTPRYADVLRSLPPDAQDRVRIIRQAVKADDQLFTYRESSPTRMA